MAKNAITLHTDELKDINLEIVPIEKLDTSELLAHRDDHFMFIIQKRGSFLIELDFNEMVLEGPALCFVAPGQVHKYIEHKNCEGWLVFIDPDFISNQYKELFNVYLNVKQIVSVETNDAAFISLRLLENIITDNSIPLHKALLNSTLETLSGLIASRIIKAQNSQMYVNSPKYSNIMRFKQLVHTKFKEIKQVNAYALILNISPLYLNQLAKEITGFSASHWINQEILMESKRLLYYTSLDIKEIAFELGYEDHTYFSRFFKKNAGLTASEFRKKKP